MFGLLGRDQTSLKELETWYMEFRFFPLNFDTDLSKVRILKPIKLQKDLSFSKNKMYYNLSLFSWENELDLGFY